MTKTIRVFAPATVANVTCGFDVLGFALDNPGDEVIVKLIDDNKAKIIIKEITGDNGVLPYEPKQNTATIPVLKFLQQIKSTVSLEITIHKKMPLGSGLGSSAASAAAAIVAVNELLGSGFAKKDLVVFALEGEKFVSGSAHADNVAPAILGGFTLIRSYEPLDIVQINTPPNLYVSVIHPHLQINTRDARSIIRQTVALKDAIQQWGNVAGLIAGLTMADYDLIARSMHDVIIEPVRSILLPGFANVKSAALANNALGCGISGSGPSLFALSKSMDTAEMVATAMQNEFRKISIDSEIFLSKINTEGCKILN